MFFSRNKKVQYKKKEQHEKKKTNKTTTFDQYICAGPITYPWNYFLWWLLNKKFCVQLIFPWTNSQK